MAVLTLDQVLTYAEALPPDEQEMLAELLKKRRIEAWREETAAYARESVAAYRTGKLKAQSAKSAIAKLRSRLAKASP
ncbi:MAG TPA: hypothetical protein VFB72_12615 [Verrucomicrobiae bacterium]|nr:hypothetical protein [Verrucomicrobiae bacterium]